MKKLILILLFLPTLMVGQSGLQLSVTQDGNLAFFEKGNDLSPFTLDVVVKAKLTGFEINKNWMFLGVGYEYADLSKSYKGWYSSYWVEGGITFGNYRLFNIPYDWSLYGGFGIINRELITKGDGFLKVGTEIMSKLFNNFHLLIDINVATSPDLEDKNYRFNVGYGFIYKIPL